MNIETFRGFVVELLSAAAPAKTGEFEAIGVTDDLVGSGLVDSHQFVDLCLAIEEKTGVIIDLGELDPEQFSTIQALHQIVSQADARV